MKHPFEHILLATEHTEFDIGSEQLAFDMALRCGLPLAAVLPVVSNPEYEVVAPQLAERAEHEAATKIKMLYDAAAAKGVPIEINARRGEEPFREIVQEAVERKSDLIITRRRGKRSFLSNLMIGEMVSKVVAHAPCCVMFVPRAAQMWSRGILAAVDASPNAELVAKKAAQIAVQCSLPLTLLSVAPHDTPDLVEQAQRTLASAHLLGKEIGIDATALMLVGKPFEHILSAARKANADLIVIGRHGEGNLIHTPFGGTTQKVVGMAEMPVLVVRS